MPTRSVGVLLRPRRRLVVHSGGPARSSPSDRPGSWPTSIRAATPPSAWSVPRSTPADTAASALHRRDDRATTTSRGRTTGTTAATSGYDPATGLGTPVEQNLAIALQGGDGCPSVAGLSAQRAGHGRRRHHPHRGRPGRRQRGHLRFRRGGAILSASETSLAVVPPSPAAALCVDVTVTNPDGTSAITPADSFAFGGLEQCATATASSPPTAAIFDFGSAAFYG